MSSEIRALLACGQAFLDRDDLGQLRRALSECPSEVLLCEAAVYHGMVGHLHRLVTSETSLGATPALCQRLDELQRVATMRSLRQTGSLLRILDELGQAGVRAMPIKGPLWAESLYGDVVMRVWADLDVLVSYDQVLTAREVVIADGYSDSAWYNTRVVEWRKEGWGHIEMRPTGANPFLELHWEVFAGIGSKSLQGAELLKRSQAAELLGRQVQVPSRWDCMLIDCVHGIKHDWDKIELLLGLATRVARTSAEDWPKVCAAAREAGCRRRLVIGVSHACRVFGMRVPAAIEKLLGRDRHARLYLRRLRPACLDSEYSGTAREDLAMLLGRIVTEDSALLSTRHLAARVFIPGPEDWRTVSLPAHLGFLYYPLRPTRLVVKWLGRLLGIKR